MYGSYERQNGLPMICCAFRHLKKKKKKLANQTVLFKSIINIVEQSLSHIELR